MTVVVGCVMYLLITNEVCHNDCDAFALISEACIGVVHNCADGNDEFLSIPLEVEWYYRSCVHALAMQWPLCVKGHICGYLDYCVSMSGFYF